MKGIALETKRTGQSYAFPQKSPVGSKTRCQNVVAKALWFRMAVDRFGWILVGTLSVQVTESFFLRNGDFSLFHTLLLGLDFFSMAMTASFSFLRISRTSAWKTSSM